MIISASYKTDIPAFFGGWLIERLNAGWAEVANPVSGKPFRVDLTPEAVDGFIFWTRHPGPLMTRLDEQPLLSDRPAIWQVTLTGYPKQLEQRTPPPATVIVQMRQLRASFGPRAVVWRYDPILIADQLGAAWHRQNFAALAAALEGLSDEVTVSFMQPYAKTRRHLAPLVAGGELNWRDPEPEEKQALLRDLQAIAARHGMRLTLCTQPELAAATGIASAACIDAVRLGDVAGTPLTARQKGNRPGCMCAEARDIGAYDTCPHGCLYCYAVSDHQRARRNRSAHDEKAVMLGSEKRLMPSD